MNTASPPLVVWRFVDGKPGHENQTAGLVQALGELIPLVVHDIPPQSGRAAWWALLVGRFAAGAGLAAPDLIVGAGHATHVPMLAARRARGGRVVVLMKPSLPPSWFDLCLVPRHDNPARAANVVVTEGVLNRIRPGDHKDAGAGLLLIGGPSRHHGWQGDELVDRVRTVLETDTSRHWTLTTSRRTPAGWLGLVAARLGELAERITLMPWEQTDADWLPRELAAASAVWVTADSVSMVYEALTSGAAVGVLPLPVKQAGRVVQGLDRLLQEGRVVSFEHWMAQGNYPRPQPFNEAQRCAQWICDHWLNAN